jgi:hypothetical protein
MPPEGKRFSFQLRKTEVHSSCPQQVPIPVERNSVPEQMESFFFS